ncbi:Thiol-disulfide isomerase or thioredoxin [Chitinophaga sp. YR627]|uniref:redoxin domain-containing protein n=1 Tax=Chitinophaga sp. YR627 TaxID=1881041 RepID=UPI0008E4FA67|nr:redoxin domain-containing protein [Chitinophaga sp. YR627]SFN88358.1 Thiol-disulfide isomerase or thioredoxin [Chitinophaga sp. YR627]
MIVRFLFLTFFLCSYFSSSGMMKEATSKIRIQGKFTRSADSQEFTYDYCFSDDIDVVDAWRTGKVLVQDGVGSIELIVDRPILISSRQIFGRDGIYYIEPGAVISLDHISDSLIVITGAGSENVKLKNSLDQFKRGLASSLKGSSLVTKSVEEFLGWNNILNNQIVKVVQYLETQRKNLTPQAFLYLKANSIIYYEKKRLDKFWGLKNLYEKQKNTFHDLSLIFDSTFYGQYGSWIRSLSNGLSEEPYFYAFNRAEIFRKYDFDIRNENINTDVKRRLLYYALAKQKYKGIIREKLLVYMLTDQTIKEVGFAEETEMLLNDYYSQEGFKQFKKWVKEYELVSRNLRNGRPAPQFSLKNVDDLEFTLEQFKGKPVILDFWFTGCVGCLQMTPTLRKVEQYFGEEVVFISICVDKEKATFLKSVKDGKYTTGRSLNLYTNGLAQDHKILKEYNIRSYPSLFMIDPNGNIINNPMPDIKQGDGEKLVGLIKEQLVFRKDGPYVFGNADTLKSYRLNGDSVFFDSYLKKSGERLRLLPDVSKLEFDISLMDSYEDEPSVFEKPDKIVVMSDIEGNYTAFKKLLLSNGIIDSSFNWTFGRGHLVLNGDIFDRGNQVTECLWLIYTLESRAKAAGGYLHFILGNHEIMNLQGDCRYNAAKYKENARLMSRSYQQLYDSTSELGQWLRTKNIMEKIGDALFVHGGISAPVNNLGMSILQINQMARKWIDKYNLPVDKMPESARILFNSKSSPLWYREYYLDSEVKAYSNGRTVFKASNTLIDSSLHKFNVSQIITGHTIVADTISVHFGGKVINTDTRHAKGKSESLFIDNSGYYRVNSSGERKRLQVSLVEDVVR